MEKYGWAWLANHSVYMLNGIFNFVFSISVSSIMILIIYSVIGISYTSYAYIIYYTLRQSVRFDAV